MFTRLKYWLNRHDCFLIADATDNSLTFSKALCKKLDVFNITNPSIFVFSIPSEKKYGFTLDHQFKDNTQLSTIQYNEKYKTIGIETLCPTVNRIFYDYGLPVNSKCKLSVVEKKTKQGNITYFEICNPYV